MRFRLAAAVVAAVAGVVVVSQAAWAGGSADFAGSFGAGPVGTSGNYFPLSVAPGGHATAAVRIWSTAHRQMTLDVAPVEGVESPNSGDAYTAAGGPCGGASCWLHGLPGTVTLAPGSSTEVAFTVHVPSSAAPGQYLAGVRISPAHPVSAASGGIANSAVIPVVDVGVAISVGTGWSADMAIPKVVGVDIGDRFGVAITETNHGTEWEHPVGSATVDGFTVPVKSDTLLPGSTATLQVVIPGAVPGDWPSNVTLHYATVPVRSGSSLPSGVTPAHDVPTKVASWSGTVSIPAAPAAPSLPTSRHGKILSAVPAGAAATAAVIGVVSGVLVVMLIALVVLWRRRSGRIAAAAGELTEPLEPSATLPARWPSAAATWPSGVSSAEAPVPGKRRPRPQSSTSGSVGGRR